MAMMLRGAFAVDGDPELLVQMQRLMPGPVNAGPGGGEAEPVDGGGRRSS
jgi:hypothetical protein